jgi:hypothetical protein
MYICLCPRSQLKKCPDEVVSEAPWQRERVRIPGFQVHQQNSLRPPKYRSNQLTRPSSSEEHEDWYFWRDSSVKQLHGGPYRALEVVEKCFGHRDHSSRWIKVSSTRKALIPNTIRQGYMISYCYWAWVYTEIFVNHFNDSVRSSGQIRMSEHQKL